MDGVQEFGDQEVRVIKLAVGPKGEPIFSEKVHTVEIADEAAGEFLILRSNLDSDQCGAVSFDPEEWKAMREAVNLLAKCCRF